MCVILLQTVAHSYTQVLKWWCFRTLAVLFSGKKSNDFKANQLSEEEKAKLQGLPEEASFSYRLIRAHANCLENRKWFCLLFAFRELFAGSRFSR